MKKYDIFVSPMGNDANSGEKNSPLKTIYEAQRRARVLSVNHDGEVNIYFRKGEYVLTSSVHFTEQDNGSAAAPVNYRVYGNEEAVFIGAREISPEKITPVTDEAILSRIIDKKAAKKLMQIDLSEFPEVMFALSHGRDNTHHELEIYEGEDVLELARFPKRGNDPSKWAPYTHIVEYKIKGDRKDMYLDSSAVERMKMWSSECFDELRVAGYFGHNWCFERVKAEKTNTEKGFVTTHDKLTYLPNGGKVPYPKRVFLYNILDEISRPGDFFVDNEKKIAYFLPRSKGGRARFFVPVLEGAAFTFEPRTRFVNLIGITVKYTRGTMISMTDARNILIENVTLAHSASNAVTLRRIFNVTFRGCHIYDFGMGGILTEFCGERYKMSRANLLIENNVIHDVARVGMCYTACVCLGWECCGAIIRNNTFYHSPHNLILLSKFCDVIIENNELYEAVRDTDDASVIYWGVATDDMGLVIRNNYFHDCGNEEAIWASVCLYADDSATGADVYNNVFRDVAFPTTDPSSIVVKAGDFSHVHNNIFIGGARIHSLGTWDKQENFGYAGWMPDALGAENSKNNRFLELSSAGYFGDAWQKFFTGTIWEPMYKIINIQNASKVQSVLHYYLEHGKDREVAAAYATLEADNIAWNHIMPDGSVYDGTLWECLENEFTEVYNKALAEVEGKSELDRLKRLHLLTLEVLWFHHLTPVDTVEIYDNVCIGTDKMYIKENGKMNLGYHDAKSELILDGDTIDGECIFRDKENGDYTLTDKALFYVTQRLENFKPFDMSDVGAHKKSR